MRYRATRDLVERSRWQMGQMLWLLVSGRRLGEVATVTVYSSRWIREVVKRYNAKGPDVLADASPSPNSPTPPSTGGPRPRE